MTLTIAPARKALIRRSVSTSPEHVITIDIADLIGLLNAADERDLMAERLRVLHVADGEGFCRVCDYGTPHPCPTYLILEQ